VLVFCVAAELLFVCGAHVCCCSGGTSLLFWIAFPALFPLQFLVVFNCSDFTQIFCIAVFFSIEWVVDVLSTNKQFLVFLKQERKKERKQKSKIENRVCLSLLCLFCGFDEAASSSCCCCCYFQSLGNQNLLLEILLRFFFLGSAVTHEGLSNVDL